jgi:hypothetical protein
MEQNIASMKGENMEETVYKIIQSFALTLAEIGMLSDLSKRTGENKSELVRRAIDLLYQKSINVEENENV